MQIESGELVKFKEKTDRRSMLWIGGSLPRIKCKDKGGQICGFFSKLGRRVCNIFWFWSFRFSTCCHQYSTHIWLWIMGLWRWTVRRLWKSNSRLQDTSTLNFSTQCFSPQIFQKKINFLISTKEQKGRNLQLKSKTTNLVWVFCIVSMSIFGQ